VGKMQGHQIPNPCDGAEWIWNLVALHFSDAIQIVDLYHARQHPWEVARKLYPHDEGERSEEHTSELQSPYDLVCRLLLEKKKTPVAILLTSRLTPSYSFPLPIPSHLL